MENTDLTVAVLQNIRADLAILGGRVDKLESRFDILERRFDDLEKRFGKLEDRFEQLEGEVAALRKDVQACVTRDEFRGALTAMTIVMNERFERIETRLTEIEARQRASHHELKDMLHQMMGHLGQHGSLAARISLCEHDIVDLKRHLV